MDSKYTNYINEIQLELNGIFKQLFSKESLRKNIYIFKNLSIYMELPIKVIAEERKVAQILQSRKQKHKQTKNQNKEQQKYSTDFQVLVSALKQCPLVEIEEQSVRLKIQGDLEVVRVKSKVENKNFKKMIENMIKDIKREIHQLNPNQFKVEFQSHAAAVQFTERLAQKIKKNQLNEIQYILEAKDPYQSLKDAISKMKKERKMQNQNNTNNYQTNGYQNNYQTGNYGNGNNYQQSNYSAYSYYGYPNSVYSNQFQQYNYFNNIQPLQIFIRRAIQSDQQFDNQVQQKNDFPHLSDLKQAIEQSNIQKIEQPKQMQKIQKIEQNSTSQF